MHTNKQGRRRHNDNKLNNLITPIRELKKYYNSLHKFAVKKIDKK